MRIAIFARPLDWLRRSALASTTEAYIEHLTRSGYAANTIDTYVGCIGHFACWLTRRGLGVSDIDEALAARFLDRHLPACRCALYCSCCRIAVRAALVHLLALLRRQGRIAAPARTEVQAELENFDRHMSDVCGLRPATREDYLWPVRGFLQYRFGAGALRFEWLKPRDIQCFIGQLRTRRTPGAMSSVNAALRSYLRYKTLGGEFTAHLIAAVAPVAHCPQRRLPRALCEQEVQRLLDGFDRTCPGGRRDYAMARCLTDLSLRLAEVARLQLDDVDWRAGTLRVRGKGRRIDLLPLPKTLGSAIVQYLRTDRPLTPHRTLFVRLHPPFDRPLVSTTVRNAIYRAMRRCGLQERMQGAHILRHTAATRLLGAVPH